MLYYILFSFIIIFLISFLKKFIFKKIKTELPENMEINEKIKKQITQMVICLLFVFASLPIVIYLLSFIIEYDIIITFNRYEVPKFIWVISCFLLSHVIIKRCNLI